MPSKRESQKSAECFEAREDSGKIPLSFYRQQDVVSLSRKLLGQYIFTRAGSAHPRSPRPLTGGIIVETEAYAGSNDRASHAFGNRRTARTQVMFGPGGTAYVYLCYGVHCLFNIVTNVEGVADAVLVRAIKPTHGIGVMLRRRNKSLLDYSLAAGPGVLSKALGIGLRHSGASLVGDEIWLAPGRAVRPSDVESGRRVGVQYAGSDALLPWRFKIRDSAWTSRAR